MREHIVRLMPDLDAKQLASALSELGDLLASRGTHYEVVLIGGGNLMLRGLIDRTTTKDLDLLGRRTPDGVVPLRPLPEDLTRAIRDIADTLGLEPDWINLGADSLLDLGLPAGFETRLERTQYGDGLGVWMASRLDMICFKLYAAVDQGTRSHHFQDLRDLRPKPDELLMAARWTTTHDPSPAFRGLLVSMIEELGVEDADAILR